MGFVQCTCCPPLQVQQGDDLGSPGYLWPQLRKGQKGRAGLPLQHGMVAGALASALPR